MNVDYISNWVPLPLPLPHRARTNSLNEVRLDHDALSKVREQKTKAVEGSSTDIAVSVLAKNLTSKFAIITQTRPKQIPFSSSTFVVVVVFVCLVFFL